MEAGPVCEYFPLLLPRPPAARRMLTALCCSAGGDTWDVIRLHLPGASEAPGAVGEQRRGPLLRQDLQPAPLPLCRLFYSKTFILSNAGSCRWRHGVVPRGSPLALAELRFANEGLRVPAKQMKPLQRFRCFLLADMLARTRPCPVEPGR